MKYLYCSLLLLSLGSCKMADNNEKETASETQEQLQPASEMKETPSDCYAINPEPENFEDLEYNITHIQTARILDGELHLTYGYSGCQSGQPYLAFLGDASGKKATVIRLKLKMQEAGLCEMYLQDSSCFNLNTIDSYGSEWEIHINDKTVLSYQP